VRVLYLHGFASSAASTKAGFFASRLRDQGISVETPDFNEPDFSTLTVSRMVDQVVALVDASVDPVALIGSSMGAFVAIQVALRRPVERLVLLAPALEFAKGTDLKLGDRSLEEWERTGVTNVFHYGYGRMIPVNFALYTDACGYECVEARLTMPILVFQGRHDTIVDPATVERWARSRPNVELHMLDDDHQLGASLEYMGREVERFLGLTRPT
jgi:pimeloyl-ACP methyl ester carboxylesterase